MICSGRAWRTQRRHLLPVFWKGCCTSAPGALVNSCGCGVVGPYLLSSCCAAGAPHGTRPLPLFRKARIQHARPRTPCRRYKRLERPALRSRHHLRYLPNPQYTPVTHLNRRPFSQTRKTDPFQQHAFPRHPPRRELPATWRRGCPLERVTSVKRACSKNAPRSTRVMNPWSALL